ncbi:MAG: amino acid ABC transporter substrate-binding protein [Oscillospiraceae bacterium]|nr:amino acid ABC transporter substrate-binding protein [Oscillospiraceae bacterium]MBQ7012700.1 amino acid ABC transporter substrate-binding protein [Oscillospiraceae bacterium]
MKTSMMKKMLCAATAAMMMLAAGCSTSETASKTENTGEDTSLQEVLDSGKLILGLDATFKPMGYTDENDEIVGFDIDLAKEVCKRMEIELELYGVNWETKELDLNAGTIDCIWNGLSVSDERKQVMLMSTPYMNNEMVFVVNGDSEIASQADLSGMTIAVQNGSTAQEILAASDVITNGATMMELGTNVEALQQLELNMVDAVFLDSVVANYEITSTGKNFKVLEDGLSQEEYAIGFRKGDQALCDKVTEVLMEMKEDGTIAKISTEWFGSDITTLGK